MNRKSEVFAICCVLAIATSLRAQDDAAVKKKLTGYWRSPRHEYEFRADGGVIMDPNRDSPNVPTEKWDVKKRLFYWDDTAYVIVSLTTKRIEFKPSGANDNGPGYVMDKITQDIVGQGYSRESIR